VVIGRGEGTVCGGPLFAAKARVRHLAALTFVAALATGTLLVLPARAVGASPMGNTYFVSNAADTGANDCANPTNTGCGIDDAIKAFNADGVAGDADTISFTSGGTFTVTNPVAIDNPRADTTLTIAGNGAANTLVSGGNLHTVFVVDAGSTVTLSGLTAEDGMATLNGGGIDDEGTLTVTGSSVDDNSAPNTYGGGIFSDTAATLTVTDTQVAGNSARDSGGGIFNWGAATVIDSTVSGNSATHSYGNAGGIYSAGTITVTGTTVSGNSAGFEGSGGGMINDGTATVTDSTLFGNNAASGGGGAMYNTGTLGVVHTTMANNVAGYGAGIADTGAGEATMVATIVAGNSPGSDCYPEVTDGGYNLDDDGSCGFSGTSLSDTPAGLASAGLASHGGPTQTVELQTGSAALGHVTLASDCVGTDQRGAPWSDPCDIGAVARTATITVDVSGSQVYGAAPGFTETNDAPQGISLTGTLACTTAGGIALSALNAGTYTLDGSDCSGLTTSDPADFVLSYAGTPAGFSISQATPTSVSIANLPASGTYGGGFTGIVSTDGDGVTSMTSNAAGVCTVSSGLTVSYVGVGPCSLTAHVGVGTDYGAADGSAQTFMVGQAMPTTVSISNLPASGTYGGGFTATVSTDGDGVTSVTSSSTSVCTVSSGLTVSYVGVGPCSLTAHVGVGTDYGAADGSAQTFMVGQAMPTTVSISNLPASGTYGGGFTATVSTDGDGVTSVTSSSTSVCTVSSGLTVSYVGVGPCSLTAHVGVGTDYGAADGSAQTFMVGQAMPTTVSISNLPASGTYGGGFTATVSTDGDGVTSVTSSSTSVCTVSSGLTVSYVGVGPCSLTAHVGVGTDYGAAHGSAQTFMVGQAMPTTVSISNLPASGTYGGGFTATVSTDGDGVTSVTSSSTSVCTVSSGLTVSYVGVGPCSLTAHVGVGTDYGAADGSAQTFMVAKSLQAIVFTSTPPADATVGGPTYTVTATGGASGNAVIFTSKASTVCAVSLGVVSFITPGTCTIYANQAGNADYSAAPRLGQTFTVGKGSQTIIFTSTPPSDAAVGGPTYTVTATGGASGNAVTFTSKASTVCAVSLGVVSFVKPGTCTIYANQAGNADYASAPRLGQTFVVGKGSQTITFTSTPPADAAVGGPPYTVTATGGASGNAVAFSSATPRVCTISHGVVTFVRAGICTITARQDGNADYTAAPPAIQSFTVG
jgi:hypothetical protein